MSQTSAVSPPVPRRHPKGLWVLFVTEMWERYSYYGMRALLVLYLIAQTTGENPGFGWSEEGANTLYGWYCGLCYLTPLLGGLLADKLLGTHRSLVTGGILMAIGQFFLAGAELFRIDTAKAITLTGSPGAFFMFMGGLALIVLGSGFFKPCASVMVGQLYTRTDPRRDAAYTIFYMGVNTGAAIAPVVTGWLAAEYGWHWGFASAGAGMILGLIVYQSCRPFFLKGIGLAPHHARAHEASQAATPEQIKAAETAQYERTRPLTSVDWDRMIAILVLTTFAIVFWIGAQQAGASLSVFAEKKTDRTVPALEHALPQSWYESVNPFPAPWYQSVNPVAIIVFAPMFVWLWGWLDRRGRQPSVPVKFGIGVFLSGVAFIPMIIGSLETGKSKSIDLAATPAPVQHVLQPVLERLIEEREQEEPEKKQENQQQNDKAKTKKAGFNQLEELVYEGATYYVVAYEDQQATVSELLDPEGNLLRRQAVLKDKNNHQKRVEAVNAPVSSLDQIPEDARAAILAQAGGRSVETVRSVVKNKKPAYLATWNDDTAGQTAVCVADSGFLLTKTTAAYRNVGLAGPQWLILMYLIVTWGELCVSPVGLSMVNKLSPVRYQAAMMGLYYGILFIANLGAGYVAALGSRIDQWGVAGTTWWLPGQADFFIILTVAPMFVGLIILVLAPKITRMMHGVR